MSSDKTLGQIAYEACSTYGITWATMRETDKALWESTAQAVKSAALPAWIKLSEATEKQLTDNMGLPGVQIYGYTVKHGEGWVGGKKFYGYDVAYLHREHNGGKWTKTYFYKLGVEDLADPELIPMEVTHFRPLPSDTPEIEGDGDDK